MSVYTCLPTCSDRNLGPIDHLLLEGVSSFLAIQVSFRVTQCAEVAFDQVVDVYDAVIDRFTTVHCHRMRSIPDQGCLAMQVVPSATIGWKPVFKLDLLQRCVGGYTPYDVLERGCPVARNLLNQLQSGFLILRDLSGIVTPQEALAILPTDIDLALKLLPLVDRWCFLYAEEEKAAVWMMTLEKERIQLSNLEHYIGRYFHTTAQESNFKLIVAWVFPS